MNVAVLGAGYAGATCARLLDEAEGVDVTWISQDDRHVLVHEAHRAIRDPSLEGVLSVPVEEIATSRFVEATVEGVDFNEKRVETTEGDVGYDVVVVAIGQRTADYGINGVRKHGLTLKSIGDAVRIRSSAKDIIRQSGGDAVVGGAGLTGVQVAGELVEFLDSYPGSHLGRNDYTVTLVEAADEVLPNEDDDLRAAVKKQLRRKGVGARTGNSVSGVDSDAVHLSSGEELSYDTFVWAGGLAPHDVDTDGAPEGERDAISVDNFLRVEGYEDAFAVGDAAHVVDRAGEEAPPTAWGARQQAKLVAENVRRKADGRALREYRLRDPGTLVSVGDSVAGKVAGNVVTGRTARTLKRGAVVRHLSETAGVGEGIRSALSDL